MYWICACLWEGHPKVCSMLYMYMYLPEGTIILITRTCKNQKLGSQLTCSPQHYIHVYMCTSTKYMNVARLIVFSHCGSQWTTYLGSTWEP